MSSKHASARPNPSDRRPSISSRRSSATNSSGAKTGSSRAGCSRPAFATPTGKSHLAQAIGRAAVHQGHRVLYREAHTLLEELADATLDGTRKAFVAELTVVPLLIVDDLGMRKLPHTAAEDLLEIIMRRYERVSTLLTSNRPVDDWGKLLGDTAAVTALLDRLLHHAHVLKCGPRSWRTKVQADLRHEEATK
jgi:DNA replication protein DnaC